jgi:ankyrin repeat protein
MLDLGANPWQINFNGQTAEQLLSASTEIPNRVKADLRKQLEAAQAEILSRERISLQSSAAFHASQADDQTDASGWRPLDYAIAAGDLALTGKLLAQSADANRPDRNGCSPLVLALHQAPALVPLLIQHRAHVNEVSAFGTPLIIAVSRLQPDNIRQLLNAGADANLRHLQPENSGYMDMPPILPESPLGAAVKAADQALGQKIIGDLLDHRADINLTDQLGQTPLFLAVEANHANIVKYLIDHGAELNRANAVGDTPLAKAMVLEADKGPTIVQLLRAAGAKESLSTP